MKYYYATLSPDHLEYYQMRFNETEGLLFVYDNCCWLRYKSTYPYYFRYNTYADTKEITIDQIKSETVKRYIESNLWILDMNNNNKIQI